MRESLRQYCKRMKLEWLLDEFDLKKNEMTPDTISYGSNRLVWWCCKEGHEFQASPSSRRTGMHCPYCVGRRPVIGVNDLETLNPELARQWHPVKNGELSPKDVQPNCKKLIWWRCDNGHEWIMCPKSRLNGQGCPVCAQEQALSVSDRLSDCFPQLVQQWNYRRNGVLKPQDVSINSAKRVWWQCDQGHEWPATVQSRTKTDIHCPICSGKRLLRGVNDLATVNPELAEQWSEKNAPITSGDVAVNSSERVWWKCPKGHLWRASVASRTSGKAICPYCKRKTSVTAELKDE